MKKIKGKDYWGLKPGEEVPRGFVKFNLSYCRRKTRDELRAERLLNVARNKDVQAQVKMNREGYFDKHNAAVAQYEQEEHPLQHLPPPFLVTEKQMVTMFKAFKDGYCQPQVLILVMRRKTPVYLVIDSRGLVTTAKLSRREVNTMACKAKAKKGGKKGCK